MKLYDLRTNHFAQPLGIDTTPYFSWKIDSEKENTTQVSYQITVYKEGSKTLIWDSGIVESAQNCFVFYESTALSSKTGYSWNVVVTDNHGETASAESCFETALLSHSDWKASWVESAFKRNKRGLGLGNQNPSVLFRRAFNLSAPVKRARLYITAKGVYRLTVNGSRVDDREMAPEYSSYDKLLWYQTYDITGFLSQGKNALGIHVGDGWYFCDKTQLSKRVQKELPAVLFQMEVIMENDKILRIYSDGNVQTALSPVVSSDLFAGERYDANQEIPDWDLVDEDSLAGTWLPGKVISAKKTDYSILKAQSDEPVKVIHEFEPVETFTSPKGETIVDFGQNFAGKVRMEVNAPKGSAVRVDCFEAVDKEGNYFYNILDTAGVGSGADQAYEYISDGKPAVYEPYFAFSGFRYVKITKPDDAELKLTGLALSTAVKEVGTFSCSNEKLNRLYQNIRWSQHSNLLSIPTDCPQREKAGWTGDISIYAQTALEQEDCTNFLTRWLYSLRADQRKNGSVPMVSPNNTTYQMIGLIFQVLSKRLSPIGVAGWGDAAVVVPWSLYSVTGNTAVLKESYESMKAWCDYIIYSSKRCGDKTIPKEDEQYLWNTGYHYGEWLIPSLSKEGLNSKDMMTRIMKTAAYTSPISVYRCLSLMSETAALLDRREDETYYARICQNVKNAIGKHLIYKDGRLRWEYMGAYVLLLYFDLVSEADREKCVQKLVEMIHENGDCLDTGFLATPFILDALSENGHIDLAYTLLYQTKAPSWLYEVEKGATTIWESWFAYDEDGNPQAQSLNHYSFGVVADWIYRNINGIVSEAPGFTKVRIQPRPDETLTFASRTFETEQGLLSVDWKKEDGSFILNTKIPCGVTATIVLPDGSSFERGSGSYTFSCNTIKK